VIQCQNCDKTTSKGEEKTQWNILLWNELEKKEEAECIIGKFIDVGEKTVSVLKEDMRTDYVCKKGRTKEEIKQTVSINMMIKI
jgi:hypothetical protein